MKYFSPMPTRPQQHNKSFHQLNPMQAILSLKSTPTSQH